MKNLSKKDRLRGMYFVVSFVIVATIDCAPAWVIFAALANLGIAAWQVNRVKFNIKEERV